MSSSFQYDFAVIGGGSGGMAAAKEAASLGARVVLFDYVAPSPLGSKWGVGGTCVNVGCIPKKLFHYAALSGEALHDAGTLGWAVPHGEDLGDVVHVEHNWSKLVQKVTAYIRKLNFSYKNGLRSSKVEYINAWASLSPEDSHVVQYALSETDRRTLSAKYVLFAQGGRPTYPSDLPNVKELCVTSDDLFTLKKNPGKTLVLGGGYIAMECAGFLCGLGNSVTVAVRSKPLRAFDEQVAEKIVRVMTELGTNFRVGVLPVSIERVESGKINVVFSDDSTEEFDTVLLATGRTPQTAGLNIPGGLASSGKINVDREMAVSGLEGVFAIGDIVEGRPELTPVAIKDGEFLTRRLFGGRKDYLEKPEYIPTTVFTPIEYGSIGFSEGESIRRFGAENIESYLFEWQTLEKSAVHRAKLEHLRENEADFEQSGHNFCKLVVRKDNDEEVVGFHYVGPHAGEVTQGFAVAMRLGAKKHDFDMTVGIHPTDAEAIVGMSVTKSSGEDYVAAGGCGGGKCG
jgi:thioredoxin/glutathione reductase (selenoprotein)